MIKKYFLNNEQKQIILNDYLNNPISIKDISIKYNIKNYDLIKKILGDKVRTRSEASKIAHKKYPEKFKHSEITKEKLRKKRLDYMEKYPENTGWRRRNISYPEKMFIKLLEKYELDKKYLIFREYPFFPYCIDFAFIDLKLAIEIDGSQHLLPDRVISDNMKDKKLIKNGWSIIRFSSNEVTRNFENIFNVIINKIENISNGTQIYEKVGIVKLPSQKIYKKVERDENGHSKLEKERYLRQRRCVRPSKDDLLTMVKTIPFKTISSNFGVSDSAIKKWCKQYGIPYRKKDIDGYFKEKTYCKFCGKLMYKNTKFYICKTCIQKNIINKIDLQNISNECNWNRHLIAEKLGYSEWNIRRLWKKYSLSR